MKRALLGCALLCACGPAQLGSRYLKAVEIVASSGGSIELSTGDDAALAGTVLTIPAGALAADTLVTVEGDAAMSLPSGLATAGPSVVWGPAGTALSAAATLTLPVSIPTGFKAGNLEIEAFDSAGAPHPLGQPVTFDAAAARVSFPVQALGTYAPAVSASICASDNDCANGDFCSSGACTQGIDGGPPDSGSDAGDDGGIDGGPFDAGALDGGSAPDAGLICQTTLDCPSGQNCINFVCQ